MSSGGVIVSKIQMHVYHYSNLGYILLLASFLTWNAFKSRPN